tara:strand:+ start:6202 stop:6420 length:219 start_codon:yes stop_codon:yes gene_type:complete
MKLSNQAMGAIMMALQKSLLEQSDIVPTLRSFVFEVSETEEEELTIKNPPCFKIDGEIFNPEPEHPRAAGSD